MKNVLDFFRSFFSGCRVTTRGFQLESVLTLTCKKLNQKTFLRRAQGTRYEILTETGKLPRTVVFLFLRVDRNT